MVTAMNAKVYAQNYKLILLHAETGVPIQDLSVPQKNLNSIEAYNYLRELVPELQKKGFLAASIDSLYITEDTYYAFVHQGKKYTWANISWEGVPERVLWQTALHKQQWVGKPVHPNQLASISEKLLQWADENGYPFARVWLDAVQVSDEGNVNGILTMETGELQNIDTIVIHGDVAVSRAYLLRHLDLKQGMPYAEKKLRQISARLSELRFLEESYPWNLEFNIGGNELHIYIKEKKANQADALIGLLPNHSETGKFLVTADVQMVFRNVMSMGETVQVVYQNLQYRSPRFRLETVVPYISGLPIGADAQFDLFKKDTSFRRTTFQLGIRYQISGSDYVRIFYQQQSNRLITIDTSWIRMNKRLPENADVSANGGGLEWVSHNTDYKLNPRKGWEFSIKATGLIRSIKKNDIITGMKDPANHFDYASLYDTLMQRKYQFQCMGSVQRYFPLGKAWVFKLGYHGGWVSGKYLFRNELFQIGGFRLLRGFDEQSIFSSQYHIGSAELRLLLDQNAYFYVFSDNAYVETGFQNFFNADMYNGFGMGATMETKSGIFTIGYALGRNSTNPVQFRQSKVHFGYLAYF